jgi:site-specific recombinase XerC
MIGDLIIAPSPDLQPAFFSPTPKAAKRVLEFFTAQISNDHTRRAYMNAARHPADWCASNSIHELSQVQPFHVAAFIKDLQDELSPPTVKQHLAALRMLFDWLVTGHIIDVNPAHAVRGPKYVVKKGKTPVLTANEARALLDSIPITKPAAEDGTEADMPDLIGLRDRALIGIMAYSFARVGAVIRMKVGDYFVQGRRRWVRLHEKGAKSTTSPVTIIWIIISTHISPRPASPATSMAISCVRRPEKRACSQRSRFPSRTPIAWFSAAPKRPVSRRVLAITPSAPRASPPI